MIKKSLTLFVMLSLYACSSAPATSMETEPKPALLTTNNSPQCHQELKTRLSEQMGQTVAISANVFSSDSRLLLEPFIPRDTKGMLRDGMSVAKPSQFNLLVLNQQCLLVNEKNQQILLNFCVCQAVTSS